MEGKTGVAVASDRRAELKAEIGRIARAVEVHDRATRKTLLTARSERQQLLTKRARLLDELAGLPR